MRLIDHSPSADDIKSIGGLYKESFGKAWKEKSIWETLSVPGTFAMLDEKGLCIFRMVLDEAEIFYIGVPEPHRKQGIASRILQEAIKFLKEKAVNKIFLEVSEENEPAINFYRKAGFGVIGKRAGYYKEGVAALNMALAVE